MVYFQLRSEVLAFLDEGADDSDYIDDDVSDNSIPDWMKEYPSEDNSPKEASPSTRITLTPMEATAELTRFRPIHGTPSDL